MAMENGLKPLLHNTSAPRDNEPDELEKIRKWQEERVARKLRGEYESAVMHLSELVSRPEFSDILWSMLDAQKYFLFLTL